MTGQAIISQNVNYKPTHGGGSFEKKGGKALQRNGSHMREPHRINMSLQRDSKGKGQQAIELEAEDQNDDPEANRRAKKGEWCRKFMEGKCTRGATCWFRHE